jgi:hypothetical protein
MALGPGKYDDLCSEVRERASADGAIVIVLNGDRGSGFSCQANLQAMAALPDILERMARQLRQDMPGGVEPSEPWPRQ